MTRESSPTVAVLPGDGIGPEVMAPCIDIVDAALARTGAPKLDYVWLDAGAAAYQATGEALPKETLDACRRSGVVLLGAMGLPHIRYPQGTEIAPQIDLRRELGLYAGLRPIRAIHGLPSCLSDARAAELNFVIVRESTEGLFALRHEGTVHADSEARDTMVITRAVSERLFDFALDLGRQRKRRGGMGRVTCVDKANVFRSLAFFRKIFDERAAAYPDLVVDHAYVDATALKLVLQPWEFDVLVTENMFGDILSDLGAGLVGGMGFAPSADIGDEHAVFQPSHGSAPDIAGQGTANPTAMILSAAIMLEWLGERHNVPGASVAAGLINKSVDVAYSGGKLTPHECGGDAGTMTIARAIMTALGEIDLDSVSAEPASLGLIRSMAAESPALSSVPQA